jgi:hypothetical protein
MGFRPAYRKRRGFGFGSKGSISCQGSSGSNGFAICFTLLPFSDRAPRTVGQGYEHRKPGCSRPWSVMAGLGHVWGASMTYAGPKHLVSMPEMDYDSTNTEPDELSMATDTEIIQLIQRELPRLLSRRPDVRDIILRLTEDRYAPRAQTESRFDRLLEELRRDREAQELKWDEQNRKWEEQNRKWHEVHKEIMAMNTRLDSSIGVLGARWGIASEDAFRRGMEAILTHSFGVQVLHVDEYDDTGEVFGRPDQVELDLIVTDGTLPICELKSSVSKSQVYHFERKVRFYERRHRRKADRMPIISPMIDDRAQRVAETLGIETYAYAGNVTGLPGRQSSS